jgi:DNA-directed RNA polymerase specialized sigma24 family protein
MQYKPESSFEPEALGGRRRERFIAEAILTATTSTLGTRNNVYATGSDFCRIFQEDMQSLYLLSLLLTADSVQAEQCFVAGLEQCATGNRVFKEWAESWAKRTIIKNAIRLLSPQPIQAAGGLHRAVSSATESPSIRRERPELQVELDAVSELAAFERFAFVMSVLEGYSDQDCALLLGCTRQALREARVRALQQIAHSVAGQRGSGAGQLNSGVDLTLPAPLAISA